MVCSWLYRTLEDSLDDVFQAQDQEMIKNFVIRLLGGYAKRSDNQLDDMVVDLVRRRLFNLPLPEHNIFDIMHRLAKNLPNCESKRDLISGLAYVEENFDSTVVSDDSLTTLEMSATIPVQNIERTDSVEVLDNGNGNNRNDVDGMNNMTSKFDVGENDDIPKQTLSPQTTNKDRKLPPLPNRTSQSLPPNINSATILSADIAYPK
jgi:hypothetical protein